MFFSSVRLSVYDYQLFMSAIGAPRSIFMSTSIKHLAHYKLMYSVIFTEKLDDVQHLVRDDWDYFTPGPNSAHLHLQCGFDGKNDFPRRHCHGLRVPDHYLHFRHFPRP